VGTIADVPTLVPIADVDDPRLADYRALTDVSLRTKFEGPHGLFIAEGELVLRRALRAGYEIRSVLVEDKRFDQVADLDALIYTGGADLLEQVTGFHVHRGVLASFYRRPLLAAEPVLAGARRIVILESLNNHTNLGAIFRSAAALGMDAVLLSPTCADPLYRRSVRVSMGEVFAVPYARLEPWPQALDLVRTAGFSVLALTLTPGARPIHTLPEALRERPALLLGAEGTGLTAAAQARADASVVIPMSSGVDSLNVGAAAAIAFWELTRH